MNAHDSHAEPARCYVSHPPLKIGEHVIYGGSCYHPVVQDADIYVGFDRGCTPGPKAFPWVPGHSFVYGITDMHAPDDVGSFTALVDWLAVQLAANQKIHLGCIGGHGRTGTVLAALVRVVTGEQDAIEYVRKNYCHKAVETTSQVQFLGKHFGITPAEPTKSFTEFKGSAYRYVRPVRPPAKTASVASLPLLAGPTKAFPLPTSGLSLWGTTVLTNGKKPTTMKPSK
jgi:hypothetical protein